MKLFHHIALMHLSESEKEELGRAGLDFSKMAKGKRGEISFDMAEDDPRWKRIHGIVEMLEKEFRAVDLAATTPDGMVFSRHPRKREPVSQEPELEWLQGYSGQSAEQLLSLEGKYRIDSIVSAFEQAIVGKISRDGMGALSAEERIVLAVQTMEREVNGGGYDRFFSGASRQFAPGLVEALRRIGCRKTANIALRAIQATGVSDVTAEAIENAMAAEDGKRQGRLSRCDNSFHETAEPIADRLFAFIKANKEKMTF